ncbi:phospholipase D1/2 [Tranquillimonas rosea]|uniref:Phospholipase D n=1 Tax=Tranquillimonas rosea TaxID=641238 RepID=A0A1H9U941_9RHOB|nr:phospholipase D-like domain-containing protein [Tranquillimonas rosea]SES05852.1 phospholipase D1/2 [Tranquillimonas rosea]
MSKDSDRHTDTGPQLLLTAAEAFPAFEELVLEARERLRLGFRVFDLSTRLRSEAGRAIGEDWFDLMAHLMGRGVSVDLLLSDFDPITHHDMHAATWRSLRQFWAAAEISGQPDRLTVHDGLHPAKVGFLPRLLFWPMIRSEQSEVCEQLNEMEPSRRDAALRDMPLLAPLLKSDDDGTLRPKSHFHGLPTLYPATHHQKIAVVDEDALYIGGLDLDERRYDTPSHERPAAETWHDVQIIARGEPAVAAARHFDTLPQRIRGRMPARQTEGGIVTTASAMRDRSALVTFGPRPLENSIRKALLQEIASARSMIFIETQFFRDRYVSHALAKAARKHPNLRLIMVLPAAPDKLAFEKRKKLDVRFGEYLQARCVRKVRRAFGRRCFIAAPVQTRRRDTGGRDSYAAAPLIYVHAKLAVFDDHAAVVSSANMNGRSMKWDTEAGIRISDAADVAGIRRKTMEHWLPDDISEDCFVDETAVTCWRELAEDNLARKPQDRRGFLLPYDAAPAEQLGMPLPGVPEEMV